MKRQEVAGEDRTDLHTKNFIDCVRSRERPAADVEIAHRSTIAVHLGNIAFRTGRKIRWDAEKEEIVDDPAASALLGRQAQAVGFDLISVITESETSMGLFWDLIQQSQINTARRQSSSLEERMASLESELRATQQLLHDLIIRLENVTGQDLNRDGRVG